MPELNKTDPRLGYRQVAEIPDYSLLHRRTIRSARNPADKATIFSIYPRDIYDEKPTIQPGKFHIPAGTLEKPAVVVVGASSWISDVDSDRPALEIPVPATTIAESLIMDYLNGLLGCDMDMAMPGMFFVAGEFTLEEIKAKYGIQIAQAKLKQDNWYRILVRLGDSLWARSNGNPLAIWDEMRLAAEQLGMERAWIRNFSTVEFVRCFACGNSRNPEFPICPICKNVDMSHPRAKEIKIAQ